MNRRTFLKASTGAVAAVLGIPALARDGRVLPDPSPHKLPRWRGFNLTEKLNCHYSNKPFVEQDFKWLATWGFDFVRLPMDFRCWAKTPEVAFNEQTMREIDQAIEWGKQYGIHVNLNFHRGPGYCVNMSDDEKPTLWTEPAAQEQFARHWGIFAVRYKGIPSSYLSFNLINEPREIPGAQYAAAMNPAIEAIRAADPHRPIIADGTYCGRKPVPELIPFGIAQSTRGYEPPLISHYMANWIHHKGPWPTPVWPVPVGINSHLYGDAKPDMKSDLVLRVECRQAARFSIRVAHVSVKAELLVKAGGAVVLQKQFQPGPGTGEWKNSKPTQQGGFAADYDRDYTAMIPAGTREIHIEVSKGDWLTFSEIRLNQTIIIPNRQEWGVKQEAFIVDAGGVRPANMRYQYSKETLQKEMIDPWQKIAAQGVGVHVGEWGAHNQTPHGVVLAWMRDCLENWKAAGFGWALWNFRGSFGILDSDRKDVSYENFKGHKLDRKMLELLRAF